MTSVCLCNLVGKFDALTIFTPKFDRVYIYISQMNIFFCFPNCTRIGTGTGMLVSCTNEEHNGT